MQVKTFKAVDMPEALRMVKSEFGPDALILSSRKERRHGFLGRFSKHYFEVTAALDPSTRVSHLPLPERVKSEANTLEEFQKSMLAPMARELKELRARVETLTVRETASCRPSPAPNRDFRWPEREKPEPGLAPRTLPGSEVEELKKVLLRSLEKTAVTAKGSSDGQQPAFHGGTGKKEVAALADELRLNGVEEPEVSLLLLTVTEAAARGETPDRLRELLKKSIMTNINCSGKSKLMRQGSRILALVGPTGVGKTTTIAKLAALAYKQGVTVALITIDTFRVGAVAQLQTYSEIMGIPLAVAATPAELTAAIAAHADKQLIFIDTAGGSPRDQKRILELKAFLDVNPAIETHLCLAVATRDSELVQAVARFGVLPVSRMIFTKLDESMSYGCIVNTHLRNKLPLSYFTTGQKVPEDIGTATSQKVADLVLRER